MRPFTSVLAAMLSAFHASHSDTLLASLRALSRAGKQNAVSADSRHWIHRDQGDSDDSLDAAIEAEHSQWRGKQLCYFTTRSGRSNEGAPSRWSSLCAEDCAP